MSDSSWQGATPKKQTAAEIIAQNIIEMIHGPDNIPMWRKPWAPSPGPRFATNAATDREYRGANALVLGFGHYRGQPSAWATFNQWKALGEAGTVAPGTVAQGAEPLGLFVKKGERSSPILVPILVKDEEAIKRGDPDALAGGTPRKCIGTKLAFGFHYTQVQNGEAFFERKYGGVPAPTWDMDTIVPTLRARIAEMGIELMETASNRACYKPASHSIVLPKAGQFANPAEFYATLLHEWTHSTERDDAPFQAALETLGGKSGISEGPNVFSLGDAGYASAELRAELGALLLAQKLGLPTAVSNSASYIESWALQAFAKEHPDYIVRAANFAQNAVDAICTPEFMLALQDQRNAAIQQAPDAQISLIADEKHSKPPLLAEWGKALHAEILAAAGPTFAKLPSAGLPSVRLPYGDLSISPAGLEAGKRYSVTADPGHGWLVVPADDVAKLGIQNEISPFSYFSPRGGKVYLEEDCDAPRFLMAYQDYYGLPEDISWHHFAVENTIDHEASCRHYRAYDPALIPCQAAVTQNMDTSLELPFSKVAL